MKKTGLLFIILAVIMAACSGKTQASDAKTETADNTFSYESFYDSTQYETQERSASTNVRFDYPQGNSLTDRFISDWLKTEMKQMGIKYIPDEFNDQTVKKLNQSFSDIVMGMISDCYFDAKLFFDCVCTLNTDKVVAYNFDYEILCSPGSPGVYTWTKTGITYDIANQKALTWDNIIPEANRAKFEQAVVKAVLDKKDYYTSLDQFKDDYFENSRLMESMTPPIFTEDGIIWNQYSMLKAEVSVVLPYDIMRGIVSAETAALFPPKSEKAILIEKRKALIPDFVKMLYSPETNEYDYLTEEYKRIEDKAYSFEPDIIIIDADPWTGTNGDYPYGSSFSAGEIKMDTPDKASVEILVTFKFDEDEKPKSSPCSNLELVWTDNAWRVYDVGGTLQEYKDFIKEHGGSY